MHSKIAQECAEIDSVDQIRIRYRLGLGYRVSVSSLLDDPNAHRTRQYYDPFRKQIFETSLDLWVCGIFKDSCFVRDYKEGQNIWQFYDPESSLARTANGMHPSDHFVASTESEKALLFRDGSMRLYDLKTEQSKSVSIPGRQCEFSHRPPTPSAFTSRRVPSNSPILVHRRDDESIRWGWFDEQNLQVIWGPVFDRSVTLLGSDTKFRITVLRSQREIVRVDLRTGHEQVLFPRGDD